MSDIHIQRFQYRARIRGAPAERLRIDRAMAEMLDGGLESALLHAGVDMDEEICIRRFVTRAKLDLARSDLQLTADWSNAWVDALRTVLQDGGDNVVRYRSRLHVLVDIARCILRGDDSRAWAWRQLGVWSDTSPRSADAFIELSHVLVRHPSAVIPVCRVLANERVLGAWIARLPGTQLRALSRAALRAVNADVGAVTARADAPDFDISSVAPPVGAPGAGHSRSVHSRIVRTMAASPLEAELRPVASAGNARDLAALIVLAAEPAALRAGGARELLNDVGRALLEAVTRSGEVVDADRASAAPVRGGRQSVAVPHSLPAGQPEPATAHAANAAARPASPEDETPDAARADASPTLAPQNSSRLHAHTGFGGLMYLLWLIEPAGVLDAVDPDRPLAVRGLRWVLRQIGRQLVSLDGNDPVLDAFTGTMPDARDAAAAEPATPAEAADIAVLANCMVELLRERLHEPVQARDLLLETLCRRPADIHFEPGWIELHFRLDTATTVIRRSGLDRDPGWVPWLGTVVKFAYV